MDLLFKRYASPFLLLNQMMQINQFSDFVDTLLKEVDEEKFWDLYLHKADGHLSFEEFKNAMTSASNTSADIETTVNDSYDILKKFVPK